MSNGKRGTLSGHAQPTRPFDDHDVPGRIDLSAFYPVGDHVSNPDISSAQLLVTAEGATKLLIQALTQNVRFTLDGTTPTAAAGFQLLAGDPPLLITLTEQMTITVIQEAATADLEFQWGN
jgi:hypothetical protein